MLTSLMATAKVCKELAMCVLRICTEFGGPDTCMASPLVTVCDHVCYVITIVCVCVCVCVRVRA